MMVPLGKVLGWVYLLGKWVRLFNPFESKASGFGGAPDSFPSSLAYPLPSGFSPPRKTPITLLLMGRHCMHSPYLPWLSWALTGSI